MNPMRDMQRDVTRICLGIVDSGGFALAGSGAIREHGLTDRNTFDVDLFTSRIEPADFDATAAQMIGALKDAGYRHHGEDRHLFRSP